MHATIGRIAKMDVRTTIARSCMGKLDEIVSDLAYLGFYNLADRLEEFTGDLEWKMLRENMLEGEHYE